jgi:hypothetical protein
MFATKNPRRGLGLAHKSRVSDSTHFFGFVRFLCFFPSLSGFLSFFPKNICVGKMVNFANRSISKEV